MKVYDIFRQPALNARGIFRIMNSRGSLAFTSALPFFLTAPKKKKNETHNRDFHYTLSESTKKEKSNITEKE